MTKFEKQRMADRKLMRMKRKRPDGKSKGTAYSDAKKTEAATVLLAMGSFRGAEEVTSVPESTLRQWAKQQWFLDLQDDIRASQDLNVESKLTKLVNKSLEKVMGMLENGEHRFTRQGEIRLIPMSARDTAGIASMAFDKKRLLQEKPTTVVRISLDDRLEKLVSRFDQIGRGETVEGEFIEAPATPSV